MPPHLGHHIQISHTTREQIGPTCARRDRHAHAIPYLAGACSSFSQASHRLRRITSAAREGGSGVHSMVPQSRPVRYAFKAFEASTQAESVFPHAGSISWRSHAGTLSSFSSALAFISGSAGQLSLNCAVVRVCGGVRSGEVG